MRRTVALLVLAAAFVGCAALQPPPPPDPAALARERRAAYVQAHPELEASVRDAILAGKVLRGMATKEIRASLGAPREMRIPQGGAGDLEWVYVSPHRARTVEFEQGRPVDAYEHTSGETRVSLRFDKDRLISVDSSSEDFR